MRWLNSSTIFLMIVPLLTSITFATNVLKKKSSYIQIFYSMILMILFPNKISATFLLFCAIGDTYLGNIGDKSIFGASIYAITYIFNSVISSLYYTFHLMNVLYAILIALFITTIAVYIANRLDAKPKTITRIVAWGSLVFSALIFAFLTSGNFGFLFLVIANLLLVTFNVIGKRYLAVLSQTFFYFGLYFLVAEMKHYSIELSSVTGVLLWYRL